MSALAMCDLSDLGDVALFKDLTPNQLSNINDLLRRKSFPAGATIISAEQKGEVVYVILNGSVKVHVEQEDGTDVIVSILGAGDIVGEMSLLDNSVRSANVVTLEESSLLWMDRTAFHECLRTIPVFGYNLACILAGRLRVANGQIQALATHELESRVARQILAFAEQYGEAGSNGDVFIPIRLTQGDIACIVGAARESVNKIMVCYKERGYISVDGNHRITIHNRKALTNRR